MRTSGKEGSLSEILQTSGKKQLVGEYKENIASTVTSPLSLGSKDASNSNSLASSWRARNPNVRHRNQRTPKQTPSLAWPR